MMSAKVLGGRRFLAPLVVGATMTNLGDGWLNKCLSLPLSWLRDVVLQEVSAILVLIDNFFSNLR
jgi:hypothetical protein